MDPPFVKAAKAVSFEADSFITQTEVIEVTVKL